MEVEDKPDQGDVCTPTSATAAAKFNPFFDSVAAHACFHSDTRHGLATIFYSNFDAFSAVLLNGSFRMISAGVWRLYTVHYRMNLSSCYVTVNTHIMRGLNTWSDFLVLSHGLCYPFALFGQHLLSLVFRISCSHSV